MSMPARSNMPPGDAKSFCMSTTRPPSSPCQAKRLWPRRNLDERPKCVHFGSSHLQPRGAIPPFHQRNPDRAQCQSRSAAARPRFQSDRVRQGPIGVSLCRRDGCAGSSSSYKPNVRRSSRATTSEGNLPLQRCGHEKTLTTRLPLSGVCDYLKALTPASFTSCRPSAARARVLATENGELAGSAG